MSTRWPAWRHALGRDASPDCWETFDHDVDESLVVLRPLVVEEPYGHLCLPGVSPEGRPLPQPQREDRGGGRLPRAITPSSHSVM